MDSNFVFYTETVLGNGLKELFRQLDKQLGLKSPLKVFLAGGMAVHLYTSSRVTTDVDAEFGSRVLIPNDLIVDVTLEDGSRKSLYFDTNYNSSFALMHEDYLDDAIPLNLGIENIHLFVLSPLDLVVSKISRFADNDKEDIATLVRLGLTSSSLIEKRATDALIGYIGNMNILKLNIRDAVAMAQEIETQLLQPLDGVEVVMEGAFSGTVKEVSAQFVVQDVGRGRLVAHEVSRFASLPLAGENIALKYKHDKVAFEVVPVKAKGVGR